MDFEVHFFRNYGLNMIRRNTAKKLFNFSVFFFAARAWFFFRQSVLMKEIACLFSFNFIFYWAWYDDSSQPIIAQQKKKEKRKLETRGNFQHTSKNSRKKTVRCTIAVWKSWKKNVFFSLFWLIDCILININGEVRHYKKFYTLIYPLKRCKCSDRYIEQFSRPKYPKFWKNQRNELFLSIIRRNFLKNESLFFCFAFNFCIDQ